MKVKNITLGGLFTAMGFILIYISSILPTSKIFILSVTCILIPISIIKSNLKTGLLIYICTSILSLLLGFKLQVLSYIMFFGIYGFIKLAIEKLNNFSLEIILKILYFNISLCCFYLLDSLFFNFSRALNNFNLSLFLIILGLNIMFIVFDYALTFFITHFCKKYLK